jgi:tetratricopeptide (TPR) repeat protein
VLEEAVGAIARQIVVDLGGVCDFPRLLRSVSAELCGGLLERDDMEELLDESVHDPEGPLLPLDGEEVGDRATLAQRLVLTHRLTAEETTGHRLHLTPDLAALVSLARLDGGLHTTDGAPLRLRERRQLGAGRAGGALQSAELCGPPGWLTGFSAGQLVAARAAGGFLRLDPVDDRDVAAPNAEMAAELADLVDTCSDGDGHPVAAEEVQLLAAHLRSTWFRTALPPFSELAEAAGLECDGDLVGRAGCWEAYKRLGDTIGPLARHALTEAEATLLLDLLRARRREGDGDDGEGDAQLARLLQRLRWDWVVAHPLVEEVRRAGAGPADLAAMAERVEDPVGAWLASQAAALAGSAEKAERLVQQALAVDPAFGPAVADAARYASDRGNAREAANLLQRVRHHDDHELLALRRWAAAGAPGVGRNASCPCGSGRKFKQCHLGRSFLPDADRVRWLLNKAAKHGLATADPQLLDELVDTPIGSAVGLDLLVFDGGWLDRFLAEHGPLLPAIEREWGERWSTSHVSSVFRVAEIRSDGRRVLEDVTTAILRTVEPAEGLRDAPQDVLVWARLVPVEERWFTTGLVRPVPLAERDRLLEGLASATTVTERRAALLDDPAPPVLQTTSGEPWVCCTTVVAVPDEAAAITSLDAHLERHDDGLWVSSADTPAMVGVTMATYELTGDGTLRIDTASLARRDAALGQLAHLLGSIEVVSDERVPIRRLRAMSSAEELIDATRRMLDTGGEPSDDHDPLDDPLDDEAVLEAVGEPEDLQAAMADVLAAQEERWLDLPLPALKGSTPRQAAEDAALLPDLRTLLAEVGQGGGGLDADRLRRNLGFDRP